MRNLVLINNSYSTFGGEDSNFETEYENLSKYFNVIKFSLKNEEKITLKNLIAIFFSNNYSSNKALSKLVDNNEIEVAYVHNTWYQINLGIFRLLEKKNITTIVKLHNFRFDCIESNHYRNNTNCHECQTSSRLKGIIYRCYKNSYLKSYLITRYSKKFFKILKNKDLKIYVLTSFHKHYLEQQNISSKKIFIQKNFVNFPKQDNKYKSDSNYVTIIGRLELGKGVEASIESILKSQYKELDLYVLGDGQQFNYLSKKYANHENIKFFGHLSNDEVLFYLKNAKFNLFGSRMYEGQPVVISESSTNNVPTILPKNGGLAEFFPENYNLFYEQDDEGTNLIKVLNDLSDEKLKQASKDIRKYFTKTFQPSELINEFKKNYE